MPTAFFGLKWVDMVDDEKNTVVNDIIQSYTELGVVNREGHNGFPSKEVIHSVLDCIKELLFPGFFGSGALEETTLHDVTQERVSKVFSILVDRKSTRLNSSHVRTSRMPSSA